MVDFFSNPIGAITGGLGDLWNGLGDVSRETGKVASDLTTGLVGGLTGNTGKEEFNNAGLVGGAINSVLGIQGEAQGKIIGGLAKAFGVEPKILLIGGIIAIIIIVVLLVVLKT